MCIGTPVRLLFHTAQQAMRLKRPFIPLSLRRGDRCVQQRYWIIARDCHSARRRAWSVRTGPQSR
jgi:hypothetical protein